MTDTATKTYLVGIVERAIAYYKVEAEDARTAAENWEEGEFHDREDEVHESEGPCNVRERQPDGKWRKLPNSEWEAAPPSQAVIPAIAAAQELQEALERAEFLMRRVSQGDHHALDNLPRAVKQAQAAVALATDGRPPWSITDTPSAGSKPFSVLLLYPDFVNDYGTETYYAFVEATDQIDAVAVAQRQAVAAQCIEIDDPTDFVPLLVTEGHHASRPLFNK
jgi:hypothetical protein